ncbi:MAG: hypothetical protein Q9227_008073 [Pyrenula ochraceoflavens]
MSTASTISDSPSTFSHLLPPTILGPLITSYLAEDAPTYDIGGYVVGESSASARLLCKTPGISVLAGVPFFDEVFRQVGCSVQWLVSEGEQIHVAKGEKKCCAVVRGPARRILLGERLALNILARSSGIATRTSSLLSSLRAYGYLGLLAGTRKTTPGFRLVEKYALRVGGADPHRHDLSGMTMLKDNHIWACAARARSQNTTKTTTEQNGTTAAAESQVPKSASEEETAEAIRLAVHTARRGGGFSTKVEVECQSEAEADAAIEAGADVVMLDNFTPEDTRVVAKRLKERWRGGGGGAVQTNGADGAVNGKGTVKMTREFLIEVSGGLREGNIEQHVCEHVDILSTSWIHQGVGTVDWSLKVEH